MLDRQDLRIVYEEYMSAPHIVALGPYGRTLFTFVRAIVILLKLVAIRNRHY